MAPKKLYLPFAPLALVIILLASGYTTTEAARGREVQAKTCKYVGACGTQAQCAHLCNGAGLDPRAIYCDLRRAGGAQCCCVQS